MQPIPLALIFLAIIQLPFGEEAHAKSAAECGAEFDRNRTQLFSRGQTLDQFMRECVDQPSSTPPENSPRSNAGTLPLGAIISPKLSR